MLYKETATEINWNVEMDDNRDQKTLITIFREWIESFLMYMCL